METRMARCWEERGCDDELQTECPHPNELMDRCPNKCAFAVCDRPTYVVTIDAALLFDPTVDRAVAIKDVCLHCEFFLTNGPRVGAGGTDAADPAEIATGE
jgi:hypothetical protein